MPELHFREADCHAEQLGADYCENCRAFHLDVGPVVVTFTPTEFAQFLDELQDTYWQSVRQGQWKLPDMELQPSPAERALALH